MKHINQKNLIKFGIPPSRANIRIVNPLVNPQEVSSNLKNLGLTAEDLNPIDWRKNVDLEVVQNQEQCGNCWAMSSTSALADRFIISKNLKGINLNPSLATQCSVEENNNGCGGGNPSDAGKFFETTGTVDISQGTCPSFNDMCTDGFTNLPTCSSIENTCNISNSLLYKAVQGSTRTVASGTDKIDPDQTIINMKKELLNGPFVVAFFVSNDFMASSVKGAWASTNGIFINGAYNDIFDNLIPTNLKSSLGNPTGKGWQDVIMEDGNPAGHAVEVVGWDVGDTGSKYGRVPYWIIKNSWGSDWNENGYFRFAMNIAPTNYNSNLGLDVPINSITDSTGKTKSLGSYFGSGTAFDPDVNSGAKGGTDNSTGKTSKTQLYFLYVCLGFFAIAFFIAIYKFFKKD